MLAHDESFTAKIKMLRPGSGSSLRIEARIDLSFDDGLNNAMTRKAKTREWCRENYPGWNVHKIHTSVNTE